MASRKRASSNLNFFDEGPAKRSRGDDETPIPWIRYDETTNQYFINDEATEFLKSIKGPLSVCSVVGNYRTGKSYLLNRLLGGDATTSNFAVSATTQSCTKGLWIMRRTIAGADHPVLVVDTEGLGSMSATETHDLRVFSLALLLSSTFLYNSTGAITEATLNNLSLVASVTEHIRMTAEEKADADELAACFPRFVYVARDFALQLVGEDGQPVDATTYLNQSLKVRGSEDSSKNRVRGAINKLFPTGKRSCVTLVRPCANEDDLQNLPRLRDSQLRPEFLGEVERLRNLIAANPPSQNAGMSITGPLLARLASVYVDAINGGAAPAIKDSWTLLSESECRSRADDARRQFSTLARQQSEATNIVAARKALRDGLEQVLSEYDKHAVGPAKSGVRVQLTAELEQQIQSELKACETRAREAIRDDLAALESRLLREATTLQEVLVAYNEHKQSQDVWFVEALPSLCRCVEAFSFRAEKKRHALQVKVDSAELEAAKVRTEFEGKIAASQRIAEEKEREAKSSVERAELAERRVEDQQRRNDELESQQKRDKASFEETIGDLRRQLEERPVAQSSAPVNTEEMDALRSQLTQREVLQRDLEEELETSRKKMREAEDMLAGMESIAAETATLKSQLDSSRGAIAELEATESGLRAELESLRSQHDEESATIQREAMETVDAIKRVLTKERERGKKASEKHESVLANLQETNKEKATGYEKRIEQLDKSIIERDAHMREVKRLFEQERTGLRDEITRYSSMFNDMREAQERDRKEFMQQVQEARNASTEMSAEHRKSLQDEQRTRRDLEMELAGVRAHREAAERRKKSLEEELDRSRQLLSQSKSSGVEVARMSAELNVLRETKDRMETEARTLRGELSVAKKSEQDARRSLDAQLTKLKMKYERQISVLESRLLE